MKRAAVMLILCLLLAGCGISVSDLFSSGRLLPPHISLLCSPLFRDADIESIIIEINAAKDEGITKSAAITAAGDVCQENSEDLLAIAMETGGDFNSLDAVAYEADCLNCYVILIDTLYDAD